jgi:3-oxoacyl-[acyl-carrier protein] reductase
MTGDRLADRVVLVTGSSRGIGAEIAAKAAAEGASVAVHYHQHAAGAEATVRRAQDLSVDADAFGADLADPEQAVDLVERVIARFGRVDALVNNAGRTLVGPFLDNIASRLGQMGVHQTAAYSAAKAGLIGLTRAMAMEFSSRGIRINAVAPGVTITEMTADLVESEEGKRRMAAMPLGRFGRADEVADAVIFLLSDDAALFVGQTLNPNSGGYMP